MDITPLNTVIIGAGVVGMALARELAQRGDEVVILEAEPAIGSVISARNSGVIHAGLYYKPGSLKAKLCVEGRDLLYAYAKDRGIWYQNCGKLVVATDTAQIPALQALKKNAEQNGVTDLRLMSADEARKMEPEVACVEAMHVTQSGVIDVHELLESLLSDADNHGAVLQCSTRFVSADVTKAGGFLVVAETEDGSSYGIQCKRLINAAGLNAQKAAAAMTGYDAALIPAQVLGKGSYFCLRGSTVPFSRLIYPMPITGSSGLHFHRDCEGRAVFGPDLEIVNIVDYQVDPGRAGFFYDAVRQYYPKLRQENLVPDYAGVRPKLKDHSDFMVQTEGTHKVPGLVQCFGIESPGVTSCLALGKMIADGL